MKVINEWLMKKTYKNKFCKFFLIGCNYEWFHVTYTKSTLYINGKKHSKCSFQESIFTLFKEGFDKLDIYNYCMLGSK